MSKKVLVISSSPRKNGNSEMLCDKFVEGAKEAGHNVNKITLKDKKIGFCVACGYCQDHDGVCTQKDDVAEILNQMSDADVLVLSTPVYYYTMSGQMKTLIDRTVANHGSLKNKEFYYIISAAANSVPAMERTIEGFRGFTSCIENPMEKGIVYGVNAWEKGAIAGNPAMQQAYEMGKNI